MRMLRLSMVSCALLASTLALTACGGSTSSPTTTTPTTTVALINEVFTGTIAPPVGGVLQSAFNAFNVGQAGTVAITLTSAIETLPGGTLLPTVTMGLGIGTVSAGTCTLLANGFVTAQGGATAQLNGSVAAAGTFCVQVSDVTNQLGPVAYAISVSHP
jgi:hypothetical protein